jgi:hypothetical protein
VQTQQGEVLLVTPAERKPGPATPGMDRQQAFATDGTWSGFVRTEPDMVSGWHHHGVYETVIYILTGALKMEFGPNGSSTVERAPATSCTCQKAQYTARAIPRQSQPTLLSCEPVRESPHSTWTVRRPLSARRPNGKAGILFDAALTRDDSLDTSGRITEGASCVASGLSVVVGALPTDSVTSGHRQPSELDG